MKVHLLYPDREWKDNRYYFDYKSILGDLGLEALCRVASREQKRTEEENAMLHDADEFLEKTMRKVLMTPLHTEAEIVYRQEILRDCLQEETFIRELYEFAMETLGRWDKLGQRKAKVTSRDAGTNMITEVQILRLFVGRLEVLRELIGKYEADFTSQGLKDFVSALQEDFSEQVQENLNEILDDIVFYADKEANPYEWMAVDKRYVKKARILMRCNICDGLKISNLQLEDVETLGRKYKKKKRKKTLMQKYLGAFAPEEIHLSMDDIILAETKQLEYQAVRYIMSYCDSFMQECKEFFEQLAFQVGFYRASLNLLHRAKRHDLECCYPTVMAQDDLCFDELKDFGMAIEQFKTPIGNAAGIEKKMLLIVTGANQGGKSTFLRSIGIAQVMMQCGLFVTASAYGSGIYPALFTHFTRREDSEMNSGRLDEELGRMSQIIDNLGERSLVFLNESFATTTEKEGSDIAYDIIKALKENGVKVLTVTHLLSFAKKVYDEHQPDVEFLSAERKADGSRTFKMIQHEPELTSFGLDLFDEIINA